MLVFDYYFTRNYATKKLNKFQLKFLNKYFEDDIDLNLFITNAQKEYTYLSKSEITTLISIILELGLSLDILFILSLNPKVNDLIDIVKEIKSLQTQNTFLLFLKAKPSILSISNMIKDVDTFKNITTLESIKSSKILSKVEVASIIIMVEEFHTHEIFNSFLKLKPNKNEILYLINNTVEFNKSIYKSTLQFLD